MENCVHVYLVSRKLYMLVLRMYMDTCMYVCTRDVYEREISVVFIYIKICKDIYLC